MYLSSGIVPGNATGNHTHSPPAFIPPRQATGERLLRPEAYQSDPTYFYLFAHCCAVQVRQALPPKDQARFAPRVQEGLLRSSPRDGYMWIPGSRRT